MNRIIIVVEENICRVYIIYRRQLRCTAELPYHNLYIVSTKSSAAFKLILRPPKEIMIRFRKRKHMSAVLNLSFLEAREPSL